MIVNRRIAFLCCIWLCRLPPSLEAQAAKGAAKVPPASGIIRSIHIEGPQLYKPEDIVRVLGLKTGQTATLADFHTAQTRLLATDLFSGVDYSFRYSSGKPAQFDLTYKVAPYEQLFPLRFEELGVSNEALRNYLREHVVLYSDNIPPTDPILRRYSAAAQEFISQTKPTLKVKAFVSSEDPSHPQVVIRPDKPLPQIAGVTVSGNKAVETPVLLRELNDVAVGTRFSDANVRELLNRSIKPLYAAKGFVAVTFPRIEATKATDNEGFIIHLEIQEGPRFHFGSSAFRGGSFTADDVRAKIHYKRGDVFDAGKAEQLRRDLVESMRRDGHLNATINLAQQEDDKDLAINLTYTIVPGPVYTFQTLNVHGLDVESEPEIRKLWAPKPGKPFDPNYPDYFLKRVRGLGLFDNLGSTRSAFTPDEATHSVAVSLYFGGAAAEAEKNKEKGLPVPAETPPQ